MIRKYTDSLFCLHRLSRTLDCLNLTSEQWELSESLLLFQQKSNSETLIYCNLLGCRPIAENHAF